ncbi:MAG: hypothetical protein ACR2IE_17075 [Candidatus Sumerlaeaceae bacterium]
MSTGALRQPGLLQACGALPKVKVGEYNLLQKEFNLRARIARGSIKLSGRSYTYWTYTC